MKHHTPGPWEVKPEGEILRVWEAQRPVSVGIADVCINRSIEAKGPSEIEHANAHLIAAAPDLLTALKDAVAQVNCTVPLDWEDMNLKYPNVKKWEAAIARAEGRTDD